MGSILESIDVWIVHTDVNVEERDTLKAVLSPAEIARARRFTFDSDRNRYISSHGILRRILAMYCGVSADALDIYLDANGKPGISIVGAHIQFNLSHSADVALIAVTSANCGADVEKIRPDLAHMEIAERFFTENENDWLATLPQPVRSNGFFRLWTIKEAVLKTIGAGLSIPLNEVDVMGVVERGSADLDVVAFGTKTRLWTSELAVLPGFAAAVAVSGAGRPIRTIRPDSVLSQRFADIFGTMFPL